MNCPTCSSPVTEHSRFCSSCGLALAELSAEATRDRTPVHGPAALTIDYPHGRFSPGNILAGRYRIIERIGQGGMGEVYRADDLTLNQPVALKFLPEWLSQNQGALKRFRSEVRTARQISHPNVCRVYDIGEAQGLQFLSMEYIHGEDLRSLLRRIGRLPPDKAVEIATELASGLSAAALLSLAGTLWVAGQTRLSQIVPLPKSPELLVADARSILEGLGYPTPLRDSTYGFSRDTSYIDDLMSKDRSNTWWELLARGEPSVIRFWYRESPQYLVPHRITEFFPAEHDPPLSVPGMVNLQLDTRGRLRRLEAVPVNLDEDGNGTTEPDWGALFAAAQFDPEHLSSVEPKWLTSTYGDRRAAREGVYPDAPEIPIRIEAASFRGRPIAFRIIEPWTEPAAGEAGSNWVRPSDAVADDWARLTHVGLHLLFILTLALLARHNLRSGRGDRKLAFRLACFFFAMVMLHWIFGAHHVPERSQLEVFFGALYRGFFAFGLSWLFYIALEPYTRKLWPRALISWVRLLDGRYRDPLVGRDVLVGCVQGIGLAFIIHMFRYAPVWLGNVPTRPDLPRHPAELIALRGVSESLSELFAVQVNIFTHILFLFGALLLLRFVFRKTWLAVGIHGTLYVYVYASGFGLFPIALAIIVWYFVFFRFGWVAIAVGTLTVDLLSGYPLTTDLSVWYAHASFLVALVCLALAIYGFKVSLAGRPAFKDLLAEG